MYNLFIIVKTAGNKFLPVLATDNVYSSWCMFEKTTAIPQVFKMGIDNSKRFKKMVIVICSATKQLGVLENSLNRVRAFQIELEFGSVGFWGVGGGRGGELEYPEKNLSKQGRETINSTHIFHPGQNSNPGQNGGRRVISPWLCLPYHRFPHCPLVPFVVLRKHNF